MAASSALRLTPGPRPAPPNTQPEDVTAALHAAVGRPCRVTVSGRAALRSIVLALRLRPNDEVWISTTLGARDRLVSPCVTATIARCCRFAFAPGPRTAAALVIHDYGMPHPELDLIADRCRRHGWPLIEDAAHAFASTDAVGRRAGTVGDFALFSLPKFFPLARGGLLLGAAPTDGDAGREAATITAELARWLPLAPWIARRRLAHWQALDRLLGQADLHSALPLPARAIPSLYVFRTPRQFATLRRLRAASVETGPDARAGYVFLPCHQHLTAADLERIAAAVLDDARDRQMWPAQLPEAPEGARGPAPAADDQPHAERTERPIPSRQRAAATTAPPLPLLAP